MYRAGKPYEDEEGDKCIKEREGHFAHGKSRC